MLLKLKNMIVQRHLWIIILCLYVGCGSQTARDAIDLLDAGAALDNPRTFDLGEIVQQIEFIPLQSDGPESLVGGRISHLTESKNVWYVAEMGKSVKLFDKTGRFIGKRGIIGRGPDEFLGITNAVADWETDNLYLQGGAVSHNWIFAYDPAGKIFARADTVSASLGGMMAFNEGHLVLWKRRSPFQPVSEPDAKESVLEIWNSGLESAGKVYASDREVIPDVFLPRSFLSLQEGFISDNGRFLFVYETLADTIFRYGNKTLSPAYIVAMGNHTPSDNAFGKSPAVRWSKNFRLVSSMMEGDRFVFVGTKSFDGYEPGGITIIEDLLIFDKRDSSGGFSAVGPDGKPDLRFDGVRFFPCYVRDNRLVGYMQAFDIVDNAAAISNPDLKALAATLKEDDNPVVMAAKLKE